MEWGWRSHRERCQSLTKIILYAFNLNKLQNLRCVFLHQQFLFNKNENLTKDEDPYFLNAMSIYVGALGSGIIKFNEFYDLIKEPKNNNISDTSKTSYYNLMKKIIIENTNSRVGTEYLKIKIPLLFQNAKINSFTQLEIDCFKGVFISIQHAEYKVLSTVLQFWSNLFSARQNAYFESSRTNGENKLYEPFDAGDTAVIYSNLFLELKRSTRQILLPTTRKAYCKNALEKYLNIELYRKDTEKKRLDEEDYITYVNQKTDDFWRYNK
jgi:hypothetical protein